MLITVQIDRQHDRVASHQRHHCGATETDHRQRNADDGHKPDHHRGVDEDVAGKRRSDAAGGKFAEERASLIGNLHREGQKRAEEHKHERAAEQAEFLDDHREDEVGVLFRQEVELALRALHPAATEQAGRPNRDLRLQHVIAGAERILSDAEKYVDALALVFMQHAEIGKHRPADGDDRAGGDDAPEQAAQEHHANAGKEDHQRRAEIRLVHNQRDRRNDHQEWRNNPKHRAGLARIELVIIARQRQHDADFHEFGRLQRDRPDLKPARRAHARCAGDFDADQ